MNPASLHLATQAHRSRLAPAALPGNAQVSIHFPNFTVGSQADSMFYWDGNGAVDFQPISTTQSGVAMSLLPSTPLDTTEADGSLHQHSAWKLNLGSLGSPVPADGMYLLSPTASVAGLADSNRFFTLFLVDHNITTEDDAGALKDGLDSGETDVQRHGLHLFQRCHGICAKQPGCARAHDHSVIRQHVRRSVRIDRPATLSQ